MTIMLSSHLLAEVQEVCNRVAVISDGRIVREGALADLVATGGSSYRLQVTDAASAVAALERLDGVRGVRREHDDLFFTLSGDDDTVEMTRRLAEVGVGIRSLVHEQSTLEDLFFRLTGPDAEADERRVAA
jgi:ABC-2 type transport system ATP-binding protein